MLLKCTKAQQNRTTRLHFIKDFVKCKMNNPSPLNHEELKPIFEGLYFMEILLKVGMWGAESGGNFTL